MASNSDFKKIFDRYRKEGRPNGISIVDFCNKNGIVYRQYERWLRRRQEVRIHPVQMTDMSCIPASVRWCDSDASDGLSQSTNPNPLLFDLRLVTSNGMLLQHRGLDYEHLFSLIQKLEVLC